MEFLGVFLPFKFEYIALFHLYINYLTILSKSANFKFYFNRNNFQIFVLQKWYIYIHHVNLLRHYFK